MGELIRVFVCDDHLQVRAGLEKLVESAAGLAVVGEAADAEAAIAGVRAEQPRVLLLDVAMSGRSGIEALPDLLAAAPAMKVLMVSMQDDLAYVRTAFAAGANGYLLKEAAATELVPAIHAVSGGRRYLNPLLEARLLGCDYRKARRYRSLSEQRYAGAGLLPALGWTQNQEIAVAPHLTGESCRSSA